MRKRRLDLKLFQKDVAKIFGTDKTTIANWERNRTHPAVRRFPQIIDFLGYSPSQTIAKTLGGRIKQCRQVLGISQRRLAEYLDVDESSVRYWEQDKHRPWDRFLKKMSEVFKCPLVK